MVSASLLVSLLVPLLVPLLVSVLVPLSLYFKQGKVKVELGLAQGKKLYDKRQTMKEKAIQRENAQQFKMLR